MLPRAGSSAGSGERGGARVHPTSMSEAFARFAPKVRQAFGDGRDAIALVARRAEELFGDTPIIIWEGNAQTFQFSFVSAGARMILGHPLERWTREATFWADHVVHPDDRDDAIAYCALATGKGRDHAFEYRANAADGRTVSLVDYVQVIRGTRGVPERLRGIMIDVSTTKVTDASHRWEDPPRETLEATGE